MSKLESMGPFIFLLFSINCYHINKRKKNVNLINSTLYRGVNLNA
jgi:hypothetical protein